MTIPNLSLEGKVAVVTGARRGMGKAIALAFAEAGAHVAVCDNVVEGGELETAAEEIHKFGRRSLALRCDVSNKSDVDAMVRTVETRLGAIDILVNNAGLSDGLPFPQVPEEAWDRVMSVNLKGCYLCSQAVAKGMVERRKGNIISVASVGGLKVPTTGRAYNVSKAGIIMLTMALASELAAHDIRVNAIAPSMTRTHMAERLWQDAEAYAREVKEVPLGRLATTDDMIGPVLFLASDASCYITGQTIVVDGGKLLD